MSDQLIFFLSEVLIYINTIIINKAKKKVDEKKRLIGKQKNNLNKRCHSLCLTLYPLELLKFYMMNRINLGSREAHVGKFLDLSDIHKSLDKLNECEMYTRNDFEPTRSNTPGWSGPKDQQNKTDIFLSVYGVMHVIVGSRKSKGKELKEWVMSDIIPRGFNAINSGETTGYVVFVVVAAIYYKHF